ncbi:MAG TPA: class I adenylate-forming enzyme family protein [Syntrophorhabdaceae bacterium]|nr:class I adenylate-forming enzyme family protein [Syntrophorhabdaceae bacterium]
MNIVEVLSKYARSTPQAPALVEVKPVSGLRREINWEQLEERTNKLANSLIQKGVKKGDKVFLLGKNSLNWLEVYFGVMKTGAWITPLNFRFTDDDIRFCSKTAEPVAFIFDEDFAERVDAVRGELSTIRHYICIGENQRGFSTLEKEIEKGAADAVNVVLTDEDECALYFTSGTTGAPKPVLIQQKSIMCSAISEATNHQLVQTDRFLMMPPMYHVAIAHMLGVVLVGACSVLLTEMVNPKLIVETVSKERITAAFLLVPWATDMLESFDNRSLKIEEYDMSSWRLTHMGAQPIPPALVKRFKSYFPAMLYDTNFGLSESMGPGIIHLGMENERKVGAIGKPTLMWDAKIAAGTSTRRS